MPTVTIYRFQKYNISSDQNQISRRWATREAVARVGAELLEDTAVEVDPSVLGREIEGMTDRDFDPRQRTGFSTTQTIGLPLMVILLAASTFFIEGGFANFAPYTVAR